MWGGEVKRTKEWLVAAVTEHLAQLKTQSTLIISPPFPSLFLFVAVEVVKDDNYTPAVAPLPHPPPHPPQPRGCV